LGGFDPPEPDRPRLEPGRTPDGLGGRSEPSAEPLGFPPLPSVPEGAGGLFDSPEPETEGVVVEGLGAVVVSEDVPPGEPCRFACDPRLGRGPGAFTPETLTCSEFFGPPPWLASLDVVAAECADAEGSGADVPA
jgi:hypothetical protein